ncbi:metallophosphoesterase [Salinicoccus sp. HZC-1]|uniref:metallophosphoesterase n=1 Tax=Salinicoccus sp. HZC-1 TaxID=3385497 RepID=UPI00398AB278
MKYSQFIIGFLIALARFLYKEDKDIVTTQYVHKSERVPYAFDGYKIVHVSDFHNARFGRLSKKLLEKIKEADGDVILITGDIIDRRTPNLKRSVNFINQVVKILPTYYVTGNHEAHYKRFARLEQIIDQSEMKNISEASARLYIGNEYIHLIGMEDLWFYGEEEDHLVTGRFESKLKERLEDKDDRLTLLMSHRPELINLYSKYPIDLVFSGHSHGGQIRLPFVKGLYAPHQGVLPKYTEGIHTKNGTSVVISRGLGNSRFPFRVFNHPEIVIVELKRDVHG